MFFNAMMFGAVSAAGSGAVIDWTNGQTTTLSYINTSDSSIDELGRNGLIDISDDGTVMIVSNNFRRVRVFQRADRNSSWGSPQSFSIGANSDFGSAVAVSGDGNTIAIGHSTAGGTSGGTAQAGRVYLYTRPSAGSNFGSEVILMPTTQVAYELQGYDVSLNYDGTTLVAGAPGGSYGRAYVYEYTGSSWNGGTQIYKNDYDTGAQLGRLVAISGDGNTIVLGAPYDDRTSSGNQRGAFTIFERTGASSWDSGLRKEPSAVDNDRWGSRLDVNYDGTRIAVANFNSARKLRIYKKTSGTWDNGAALNSGGESTFGSDLHLNNAGDHLVIGVPGAAFGGASQVGKVMVWKENSSGVYTSVHEFGSPSPGSFYLFGSSVAMSGDGLSIAVGEDNGRTDRTYTGAAYVFDQVVQAQQIPVVSGVSSITSVENTSTITILATFTATGGGITWSLSGTDAANFSIDTSGQLRFAVSPDYETTADRSQSINVVATNAVGSDTLAVSVTVTNNTSDDPPVFTNGAGGINLTRQEGYAGSPLVFGFRASGGGTISWSVGGTDGNQFNVNSVGDVSFNSDPDYDNPTDSGGNNVYNFSVTASSVYGSATVNNTVTITNDPSDDVFEATVTAHGSSTVYDLSSSGDSFTLTAVGGGDATLAPYSSSTYPKLLTMTVNSTMTVDLDVRGGAGGGGMGGAGGRMTGRVTLNPNTTYYLITGARGANGTSAQYGPGGYGGGGAGGGGGRDSGTAFGDGGVAGTGSNPYGSGDVADGGGGLSGLFSGSPSQANAILIAAGGGGMGASGNGGSGGGGSSSSSRTGTAGGNHGSATGGGGGTASSGGAGGQAAYSGGAGYGGGGGWSSYSFGGTTYEGGGGGGGGYYGGGGGGSIANGNNGAAGGGGSAYASSAVSNVGGSRGYNTGEGRITITRV